MDTGTVVMKCRVCKRGTALIDHTVHKGITADYYQYKCWKDDCKSQFMVTVYKKDKIRLSKPLGKQKNKVSSKKMLAIPAQLRIVEDAQRKYLAPTPATKKKAFGEMISMSSIPQLLKDREDRRREIPSSEVVPVEEIIRRRRRLVSSSSVYNTPLQRKRRQVTAKLTDVSVEIHQPAVEDTYTLHQSTLEIRGNNDQKDYDSPCRGSDDFFMRFG